ncbi:MAG: RNA polymerase sigma factor [Planctomycetes bacterium]|nr:RNA polymerase sigma factor [Planctomycetota bacterium]
MSRIHAVDSLRMAESSTELMNRAARGDRASYAELVDKYAGMLRRVSYLLLHSSAEADDAVQETFALALQRVAQFRGEGEPRGWFYTIALNVCRRRQRERKVREHNAEPAQLETGRKFHLEPRGVLTSLVRRETARQLAIALGFLTNEQREAFVLHYVEELPHEEIAALLGVTAAASRALAHRARVALQDRMPGLGL